jgi:hypothetical protein
MFSGEVLLGHNTVNELCYVAQQFYGLWYENDDIFKNG